jgi:transcriptional regulator with XRE-family HTH domain
MEQNYSNIYAAARNSAGLTRERAAELLGLSYDSVKAYERDITVPPDETVLKMVDLYSAPFLAVQHLRASALAQTVLPEVQETDLSHAVIHLINSIRDFAEAHRTDTLMTIADDGVIDEAERALYNEILGELDEIVKAAMAFKYVREESI